MHTSRVGWRFNHLGSLRVVLAAATLAGCGGSNPSGPSCSEFDPECPGSSLDYTDDPYAGDDPYFQTEAAPAQPFSQPVQGLIQQDVWWANTLVGFRGARVERGMDPEVSDARRAYVEVDLDITSHESEEVDYSDRATWDLVLATGERLRSIDTLGLLIAPGDTARLTLHYPLQTETVSLTGAYLELNGSERGGLEPEKLRLDVAVPLVHSYQLTGLVGATLQPDDVSSGLRAVFHDARYGTNSPIGMRAAAGERFVTLSVAITYLGAASSIYIDYERFGIVIDGYTFRPETAPTEIIHEGETIFGDVVFAIDAAATMAEVAFNVGGGNFKRLPVNFTQIAPVASP